MTDSILTPKAERTRQHILDTALDLFVTNGYDSTTMRDIAAAADCSLGLAYRYFDSKEALVLMLYQRMSAETVTQIEQLPAAPLADRFYLIMTNRLRQATPYRGALGALFGTAMNPDSGAGLLGATAAETREEARRAFIDLVSGAKDAPKTVQAEHLGTLLYSLHFALILFWLYDRSPGQRITGDLLDFVSDMLGMARPVLILSFVAKGLARLAGIMEAVFVGE